MNNEDRYYRCRCQAARVMNDNATAGFRDKRLWQLLVPTLFAFFAVTCVVIMGRNSCLKYVLLRVEMLSLPATVALLLVLYTSVSLPLVWGYSILNVAGGYLYGTAVGVTLTVACAIAGVATAHVIMTRCIRGWADTFLAGALDARTIVKPLLDRRFNLQLVFLARLTPVPFGLQNAVFSMSGIPLAQYLGATVLGLLPTQVLYAYLGSTLRSMEDVFAGEKISIAWIIMLGQVLLSLGLVFFITRKVKGFLCKSIRELDAVIAEEAAVNGCCLQFGCPTSDYVAARPLSPTVPVLSQV